MFLLLRTQRDILELAPKVDPFLRGDLEGLRGSCPRGPHTALLVARRTGNLSMWGAGAQGAPQTVWSLVPRPQATKATGRLQVVCEFATWTRGATQSPSLTAS